MSDNSRPQEQEASLDTRSDHYTFGEQVGLHTISGALVVGAGLVWTGGENFISAQQSSSEESAVSTVSVGDRDVQIPETIDTLGALVLGTSLIVGGFIGVRKLKTHRNN